MEESEKKKTDFNVNLNVQEHGWASTFNTVWAKFIFGPALFLVLLFLLIVTILDYRAKIVFDNNQQIIVETLANFIQEERLNNRKLIESSDLSYEQNKETEIRVNRALDQMQKALDEMHQLAQHVTAEIESEQLKLDAGKKP
jgi:hypothetical protein